MHAYELRIPEQDTALPQTINFEARDDESAMALVRSYYTNVDSELWHERRLIRRFDGKPSPYVRLPKPSA